MPPSTVPTHPADPALLRGLRHLLQIGRVAQVHRGAALERVGKAQLLADLAHRRHHLLAQQADAGPRVLVADAPVIAPEAVNARAGFFEHATQLRDDRLWRAVEHPPVGDLRFEGRSAPRALRPPDRELDKLTAMLRREITRRSRPHRMSKAGKFALHPQELAGVLLRLFLAVGDMDLLQITAVLGAGGISGFGGNL